MDQFGMETLKHVGSRRSYKMFNDRREETEKEKFSFIVLVEVNENIKNYKFIVTIRILIR
jgi:hypothetical protein